MSSLIDHLNFGNIYFNDNTYSPETIRTNIDAVAENLTKRFISNSPFVYLFAPNHIKAVYGLFGILKAGRICVLVDPAIGRLELEEMIKDAAPGAIIKPDNKTDTFDFFKEIEVKHYQLSPTRIQGMEDVAIMLYTAADDGFAKGVMLTHENLLANARALVESNNVNNESVTCSLIAFHHLFSLQTGVITPSIASGNLVIADFSKVSSIRKISENLDHVGVTHFYAVPLMFHLFKKANFFKRKKPSDISIVSGGCKLPEDLFNSYLKDYGLSIHEGYGLTEASPICAWHRPLDKIKIASVGRSFPCCDIKSLDENNHEVSIGNVGEICVKGGNVMKGYFNNESATRKVLIEGWLHTGDLGTIDHEGYVNLTGLKKRMLNVGGNKVFPAELERYLRRHDNVVGIEIYGEPDELLGNVVKALVRLRSRSHESEENFKEWCSKNITKYKIPRSYDFTLTTSN
jgi:long-chain acyl-CoA synthetase